MAVSSIELVELAQPFLLNLLSSFAVFTGAVLNTVVFSVDVSSGAHHVEDREEGPAVGSDGVLDLDGNSRDDIPTDNPGSFKFF